MPDIVQYLRNSLISSDAIPSKISCIASWGNPPPNMEKKFTSNRADLLLMPYIFEKCSAVGPVNIATCFRCSLSVLNSKLAEQKLLLYDYLVARQERQLRKANEKDNLKPPKSMLARLSAKNTSSAPLKFF